MSTIFRYYRLLIPICSILLSAFAVNAMAQSSDLEQAHHGDAVEVHFDIANVRIGSRDADRSGSTTYTAPTGFTILGHEIHRQGFHSGVSHVETTQPGHLTYENRAVVSLTDAIRRGFVDGSLSLTDDESSSAVGDDATGQYLDFLRRFEADYRFVANTNATVTFSWFVDSKSFVHGAALQATAVIRLQRAATESDADRATELIRFALESDEKAAVFELMDRALGLTRPLN